MHISSQLKDYGLLTQMHGSFQPLGFIDSDINEEFKETKPNIYSRSRTNKGKRSTLIQERFVSYKCQILTAGPHKNSCYVIYAILISSSINSR